MSPRAQRATHPAVDVLLPVGLVLLTLICFWPLTRFYFAQDDFVFLERANQGFASAVGGFFSAHAGQFRPLTKGLYFLLTWPVIGLHPAAYHVLSILLHAVNALLLAVLLCRMGVSKPVGWFVAAMFACNVAFIEAVAWVSCVQQLIGNAFMLLALILGIDALEGRGRHRRLLSTVALALAYGSYEQTLAAPVVLAGWYAMRYGVRPAMTAMRTRLWEWAALLLLYLVFTLGVRGVPDSGPYTMSLGPHVLGNLRQYTGLAYHLWVVLPPYGLSSGWTPSHIVWGVVIGVLVWRRRLAELAFGLGTFMVLLLPVLFFKDHTHTFHLYVPALGAWFLAAAAIGALLDLLPALSSRTVAASLLIAGLMVGTISAVRVRANANANISDSVQLPPSFVLRRAVLAQRMRDDLLARTHLQRRAGRMILAYPYPQYAANWRNIYSALGQGSGVRLMLESPDLDVVFVPPAELPENIEDDDEVMVFTEAGRCYTYEEYAAALDRKARAEGHTPDAPADTTTVQPMGR